MSRAIARVGFVDPTRAQWAGSQALLSHPRSSPGIPSSVPECQVRFPCRPSRPHTFHEPEAPSADRSHQPLPSHTLGARLAGRHWYPDFAAKGPASDMLSRPASPSARLKPVPAFTGVPGPHAAYRLLQRSAPRAHLRAAQTPRACRSGKPLHAWMTPPLAGLGQPSCFRPGVALALWALSTPIATTARHGGFTPT